MIRAIRRPTGTLFALVFTARAALAYAAPGRVVLIKRSGVAAYEEASEEFTDRCRIRARMISFGDEGLVPPTLTAADLVVTIGQEAFDAMRGTAARLIPALAFYAPADLPHPAMSPPPDIALGALLLARPGILRVGMVYGQRGDAAREAAEQAAVRRGIRLLAVEASGGPGAVRVLRTLADQVDALWLPGDPDVVTPQVFQYALRLQLERGLPLLGATRQQVHAGALVAVDFNPRMAGRAVAELTNRALDGRSSSGATDDRLRRSSLQITVNRVEAHRLSANLPALGRLGAHLE